MYGYDVRWCTSHRRGAHGPAQKGVVVIEGPDAARLHADRVARRRALRADLLVQHPGRQVYSTFDWGIRDEDGYFYILGRTDDVINVAGHRLGTREIEESISSHPTSPRWRWWAWPTRSRARWRWPSRGQDARGSPTTGRG
jgi:propionyl-CoA synthetase